MLTHLSIKNIVLVDSLDLDFTTGLTTLTGETGAGKSILLDAIGLVIGGRGDSTLVRHGTEKASITASFDIPQSHPVWDILSTHDIDYTPSEPLLLRRVMHADGKSRAFIGDTPTPIKILRNVGDVLIDVQGQFEQHGLLSPKTHLDILDSYANIPSIRHALSNAYTQWKSALDTYQNTVNEMERTQKDAEYIAHCLQELDDLSPILGEYEDLQIRQNELKNTNAILQDYNASHALLDGDDGILSLLSRVETHLERIARIAGDKINPLMESVIQASSHLVDVAHNISTYANDIQHNAMDLESIQDRIYSLNTLAQKHRTTPDGLVDIHEDLSQKHQLISNSDTVIETHLNTLKTAYNAYIKIAKDISDTRKVYATKLTESVCSELPNLALNGAEFSVHIDSPHTELTHLDIAQVSPNGYDTVVFHARTNTGGVFSPIHKSASGGELSRLLLAINVVLSHTNTTLTLMFDEIDAGVGGQTADKIGTRLQRLSDTHQVLVITHSPQVASAGHTHLYVEKRISNDTTTSHIHILDKDRRIQEIARMLSGDTITDNAINNAKDLLGV